MIVFCCWDGGVAEVPDDVSESELVPFVCGGGCWWSEGAVEVVAVGDGDKAEAFFSNAVVFGVHEDGVSVVAVVVEDVADAASDGVSDSADGFDEDEAWVEVVDEGTCVECSAVEFSCMGMV